jgi:hypothetical protein
LGNPKNEILRVRSGAAGSDRLGLKKETLPDGIEERSRPKIANTKARNEIAVTDAGSAVR